MKKQKLDSANQQEVSNETASEETANASTEAKTTKTLEELQREFDRLSDLFNRKNRFQKALNDLAIYAKELKNEDSTNLESNEFKLVLGHGYSKEDLKLSNREVIAETVNYLRAKISATIEAIESQILNA